MLKITDTPEFTHTVRVQTPVDGGHREDTFKCRFRVVEDDENDAGFTVDAVKARLRRIIVSMEDLADENGKPVPYSDEVRDRVLNLPHARIALLRAYAAAFAKERAGN
ncbi:hypothetical protein QO034_06580 [Sedimentitalea sp. JM2-8]|uniref:Phage tail assembly chaperone n=1 Tax=Sedimentitalea xiamensis TaxID=3050037 RepID=A0ABT7FCU0_9RHOB|nr:hypothetical protein [Sedimentitalea xiamensis]MDK3072770.1 hypothetical protein [Sedimentitalea xiamensis]